MQHEARPTPAADLSRRLIEARLGGPPVPADWDAAGVLTAEESYEVQALVQRSCGPVGGFKVACKPGRPRIMAPIFEIDVLASPARLACPEGEMIGIELELGFRVVRPLPARDAPDREALLADCLELVPVMEIVRTRLASLEGASPGLILADNQSSGGLVVGAGLKNWSGRDVARAMARLDLGGKTVLDGAAEVPGGDAFANFKALEEIVEDHCGGLRQGQVVITGSLNGLPFVAPGLEIRGEIRGLGAVELDLVVERRPATGA